MRNFLSLALLLTLAAAPATAPTSAPFDQSTPKGTLKVLSRALDAGDRKTILQILSAASDSDRKLADATADLAEANVQMRRAAIKAFGEVKSRALGVDPEALSAGFTRIDTATEAITGDSAIVTQPGNEGPPMSLVKTDNQWRLPVAELRKDVEAADVDRNIADVQTQIGLMKEIATEVAAGKFATAADARQALDQRILKGAMSPLVPTTAPATHAAEGDAK